VRFLSSLILGNAMGKFAAKLERLLTKCNVSGAHGATAEEIAAFEKKHRRKLTPAAKEFFSTVNGADLEPRLSRLWSLDEASDWIERWGTENVGAAWKYVPLGGPEEPDPYCVACGGAIKGMVLRVPHDDEATLAFRSIESWLGWLMTIESRDEWVEIWDKPHELDADKRIAKDFTVASKLQEMETFASEIEETDAQRFSMALMSEAGLDLFAKKLKASSIYTRQSAEVMLSNMKSPRAAELLQAYAKELEEFAHRCLDVIRNAEPQVEELPLSPRNRSSLSYVTRGLRSKNKEVFMNLGAFYPDTPTNLARLVEMARFNLRIPSEAIPDEALGLLEELLDRSYGGSSESREAEAFLIRIPRPQAGEMLERFRTKVNAFADVCVSHLNEHGMTVSLRQTEGEAVRPMVVLAQGGKVNELDVRSLYGTREEPDFWERLLARAKRMMSRP
jgi:hypothetical protein